MAIMQDVRDTWRSLIWSPYFTIPVVLSLAMAIGGNVAAFSVVNALLLRPLPIHAPDRVFHLTYVGENGRSEGGNYSWFELVRDRSRTVAATFIDHRRSNVKVVVDGQIEAVSGTAVSGDYFPALGLTPRLGRLITSSDESGGTPSRVAVISDAYWSRRFGRDPAVVARMIRVDNVPHEIVGVTRAEFAGLEVGRRADITVPMNSTEYRQGWSSMAVLVRLRDDVSADAAAQELTSLLQEFVRGMPPARARARFQRVEIAPIANGMDSQGGIRDRYATPAVAASMIIGVMLLLACSNWAMLLLARASARRRELAIRIALGSSRRHLVRQIIIESLTLAVAGGSLGLLIAWWIVRALPGNGLPADLAVPLDARVVLFGIAVTFATGVLFAIAPTSLTGRIDAQDLRRSGRVDLAHTARVGKMLVVAQVALSLILVVAAGFLGVTLRNLRSQAMGFSDQGTVTFALDADGTGTEGQALIALHRHILARLRAIPGVRTATLATVSPLSGNEDGKSIAIPGFVPQSPDDLNAQVNTVAPEYFETFGISILKGRGITEGDAERAPHVALISESAARYYFPRVDPIGRSMEIKGSTMLRPVIIGIVPDVMYRDLRTPTARMFYVPFYQRYAEGEYEFAVTTDGDPETLARQVPGELAAIAPTLPVLGMRTLASQIDARTANERLLATMSSVFGTLGLVLAGIGVYGVVSYTVSRRIPEIGIRLAFGAPRRHVIWQIARGSVGVVAIGLAIGLAVTLSTTPKVASVLFGVAPTDLRVFATGAGVLLGVGVVAMIPPLRRALRVDPMTALRTE